MTPPGPDQTGKPASDDAGDGFRNLADAAARILDGYARVMGQVAGGGGGTAPVDGLSPALAEAWMIASGSAMRYGQGLTEVFARHQSPLLQSISAHASAAELTPEQKRQEAEALRHFLREVGETATFEARRLQKDLAKLSESIADGASGTWPEDTDHRVWETKP